jgi:isoquinoline 1-oxidoreductase beta subunit
MFRSAHVGRRTFFEISTAAGALIFGLRPSRDGAAKEPMDNGRISPFLSISPDNVVTLTTPKTEMGQGAHTGIAVCIAEELEVDWRKVHIVTAPSTREYRAGSAQSTGGSSSIRLGFESLRQLGATAREALRSAAAEKWGVSITETRAEAGMVVRLGRSDRLSYGELVPWVRVRSDVPPPALKPRGAWTLIGRSPRSLDIPSKTDGSAIYGMDVRLPGMVTATVRHCPVLGGTLASVDPAPALQIAGVRGVVTLENAVVVAADNFWLASRGCDALNPLWDEGEHANADESSIASALDEGLASGGEPGLEGGKTEEALKIAARVVTATYEVPYLSHAPMEPMNATAWVRPDGIEIWGPVQTQTKAQQAVARALNVSEDTVVVHTPQLGGSFGRRLEVEYVVQSAMASRALGRPVKLIWSREEDMRHGFYRPRAKISFRGALDQAGTPTAIDVVMAEDAFAAGFARINPAIKPTVGPRTAVWLVGEGYGIKNFRYAYAHPKLPVPIGAWRAVQYSHNGFFGESFIDELAVAAGIDPLAFRSRHAANHRYKLVLEAVAQLSNWSDPLPPGKGRGVAMVDSFDSVVAQVVELTVGPAQDIHLDRVSCVIDCGTAVHPSYIKAQMEGSIVYGLTAAFFGEITVNNGKIEQGNFDTYEMIKLQHMPEIRVQILESEGPVGGVGEPGLPPIGAALTNALFAACGERVRRLPLRRHGWRLV